MATLKQLKKLLKKAGLKASGSKRALTRRAKKAHLKLRGGAEDVAPEVKEQLGGMVEEIKEEETPAGGRRRSRRHSKGRKHSRRH